MSMKRCDRHDEEYDTDHRSECFYCEQEAAEAEDRRDDMTLERARDIRTGIQAWLDGESER